jgi:cellulose synthase/poly-beta-1,6-N-acetylglucosamine synthase-like glycosyltransferase
MIEVALIACALFFAIVEVRIVVLALSVRRRVQGVDDGSERGEPRMLPSVAVQLPVYREARILPRLLEAVARLDYPPGLLSVQVLDDSEDEAERAANLRLLEGYRQRGIPVSYLHREERTGYKSGALNAGTALLDSDLVAIFDADFEPDADFLRRTVPRFDDPRVACVHSRWRHPRAQASSLGALQSAVVDCLFCFESAAREARGESSMYLGTCGVWRRSIVRELGGWKEAPFTDDGIDLSFRARRAGFAVVFVDEELASADLPATWVAYKNQQRRWARAAFRLFLDHGSAAVTHGSGAGRHFLELSSLHLVLSTPVLLLAGTLTAIQVVASLPRSRAWTLVELALLICLVLFPPVQECVLAQRALHRHWVRRSLRLLPALPLALGVGVSILAGFHDTIARREPEFVRTPKGGAAGVVTATREGWHRAAAGVLGVELAVALGFATCAALAAAQGYPEAVPLLAALGLVLGVSVVRTTSELRKETRVSPALPAERR